MNQKNVKLLRKYSSLTGRNHNELKKWWNSLNWIEKTEEKKKIIKEISK